MASLAFATTVFIAAATELAAVGVAAFWLSNLFAVAVGAGANVSA